LSAAGSEAALARIERWSAAPDVTRGIAWTEPPKVASSRSVNHRGTIDLLCEKWTEWAASVGFRLPSPSERAVLVHLMTSWANLALPPLLVAGLVSNPLCVGFDNNPAALGHRFVAPSGAPYIAISREDRDQCAQVVMRSPIWHEGRAPKHSTVPLVRIFLLNWPHIVYTSQLMLFGVTAAERAALFQ
jgi:hypothetical protein